MMFAANMFALLLAIQLLPLSIAILTYFVYPLLTGLAGAATGIDRVGWRGLLAALAAFIGLAMMLGARLGEVELVGVAGALAAAVLRVVIAADHPCQPARHGCAAEHLVFAGALRRGVRAGFGADADLESAAIRTRLGGVRRHERHQHASRC